VLFILDCQHHSHTMFSQVSLPNCGCTVAYAQVLLRVFACRSATVHEEALLAVGAFTYTTGKQFVKYMDSFFPVLQTGLTNHQVRPFCRCNVPGFQCAKLLCVSYPKGGLP